MAGHDGSSLTNHITKYLASRYNQHRYSDASVASIGSRLRSFAAHVGRVPVAKITWRHVESWVESLRGRSQATRAGYLSALRVFCKWMVRHGHMPADPTAEIEPIRQPVAVPKAQPARNVRAVVQILETDRERICWWLMYGCALRRAEVAQARLEHYDPDNRILLVDRGKGGKQREVYVPDPLAVLLDARLDAVGSGPLVERLIGNPDHCLSPGTIGKLGRGINERAGLRNGIHPVTNHAWRHTCATEFAAVEPDLRVVQEMLGHSYLTSTQIYLGRLGIPRMKAAQERRTFPAAGGVVLELVPQHRSRSSDDGVAAA